MFRDCVLRSLVLVLYGRGVRREDGKRHQVLFLGAFLVGLLGCFPVVVRGLLAEAVGLGGLGVEEFFALQVHDLRGRFERLEFLGVCLGARVDR